MEARFPTLDLERVEVLKGPQGILFGQNSTAGAINFIAAKPTDTVAAGFDASYGRFDTIELRGFLSAPVSDTLKVRVAAMRVPSTSSAERRAGKACVSTCGFRGSRNYQTQK